MEEERQGDGVGVLEDKAIIRAWTVERRKANGDNIVLSPMHNNCISRLNDPPTSSLHQIH
jgi:hypothetical protein